MRRAASLLPSFTITRTPHRMAPRPLPATGSSPGRSDASSIVLHTPSRPVGRCSCLIDCLCRENLTLADVGVPGDEVVDLLDELLCLRMHGGLLMCANAARKDLFRCCCCLILCAWCASAARAGLRSLCVLVGGLSATANGRRIRRAPRCPKRYAVHRPPEVSVHQVCSKTISNKAALGLIFDPCSSKIRRCCRRLAASRLQSCNSILS